MESIKSGYVRLISSLRQPNLTDTQHELLWFRFVTISLYHA